MAVKFLTHLPDKTIIEINSISHSITSFHMNNLNVRTQIPSKIESQTAKISSILRVFFLPTKRKRKNFTLVWKGIEKTVELLYHFAKDTGTLEKIFPTESGERRNLEGWIVNLTLSLEEIFSIAFPLGMKNHWITFPPSHEMSYSTRQSQRMALTFISISKTNDENVNEGANS